MTNYILIGMGVWIFVLTVLHVILISKFKVFRTDTQLRFKNINQHILGHREEFERQLKIIRELRNEVDKLHKENEKYRKMIGNLTNNMSIAISETQKVKNHNSNIDTSRYDDLKFTGKSEPPVREKTRKSPLVEIVDTYNDSLKSKSMRDDFARGDKVMRVGLSSIEDHLQRDNAQFSLIVDMSGEFLVIEVLDKYYCVPDFTKKQKLHLHGLSASFYHKVFNCDGFDDIPSGFRLVKPAELKKQNNQFSVQEMGRLIRE